MRIASGVKRGSWADADEYGDRQATTLDLAGHVGQPELEVGGEHRRVGAKPGEDHSAGDQRHGNGRGGAARGRVGDQLIGGARVVDDDTRQDRGANGGAHLVGDLDVAERVGEGLRVDHLLGRGTRLARHGNVPG